MAEDEGKGITDEQRAEVVRILLELLRAQGSDIKEGAEVFRYILHGKFGKVKIDFEIEQVFPDWAMKTSRRLSKEVFVSIAEQLKIGKYEIQSTGDEYFAATLAFFVMQGMIGKLKAAFFELELEAKKLYEAFLLNAVKEHPTFIKDTQIELPNIAEDIKALAKAMATERRKYLTRRVSGFRNKPQLERLSEHYPILLKVWQSVKKIYEDNGESETWRDMVKAKYPELTFDDDLLTRVTGKLDALPEDIQAKLAEKDGDHTPHTIALEHAARMCGALPYQYGVRYYNKLKSGKGKTEQGGSS